MNTTKNIIDLNISGMTCGGCVKAVTAALSRVPGVVTRSVAVGKASIEVESDAGTEKAIAEIKGAGFDARSASAVASPVEPKVNTSKCGCGPSCGK